MGDGHRAWADIRLDIVGTIPTPSARPDAGIATLYRDHHSWLHGWLRLKLSDAHRAADLVQDTFVRLLSAKSTSPSDTALREPRAYLRTVANRLLRVDAMHLNGEGKRAFNMLHLGADPEV